MKGEPLFELAASPLDGVNLIEASAGTGKTFTITGLFLRLLLEKGLEVREILVVTFTEAATAELKSRIRSRLRDAEQWLAGTRSDDPLLETLLGAEADPEGARRRLHLAVTGFDEAAIFTIHGFCQRILRERAFESGALFDTKLTPDLTALQKEVVEDYWRRHFYEAHPLFVRYAMDSKVTPASFLDLLGNRVVHPDLRILPPPSEVSGAVAGIETCFVDLAEDLADQWRGARADIPAMLEAGGALKQNSYKPENVARWCAALGRGLEKKAFGLLGSKELGKFSPGALERAVKKGKTPPSHPVFDLCGRVEEVRADLLRLYGLKMLGLKRRFFDEAALMLDERKRELNIQSFDDLLLRVHAALRGGLGGSLAKGVRGRFKAALIDEFQDTDPVQYEIFKNLFGREGASLFLIGDPKQAIYSFRGADVFAYMQASGEAERRYTLGENWRSEAGLIHAVNTVFGRSKHPFLYDEIGFQAVAPAVRSYPDGILLERMAGDPSPLQIWFMDGSEGEGPLSKGRSREAIHGAVTGEIVRLLTAGREGRARIGNRPLQEKDIAVLVRRNAEARRLQETLAQARVPSVLYSTGSLFDAPEALEMERLLGACLEPENEDALKAALVTRSMGLSGEELYRHMEEEAWWEAALGRFRMLHEIWRRHGFFPMFRHLLLGEGVLERLMALPDGERRATNLLHLAEVLHTAAAEGGQTMDGMLKWLRVQRDPSTPRLDEHQLRLESDENAVTIITVHRAKGLQWPVVFCPFLWDGLRKGKDTGPLLFHDPAAGARLTLDLGSDGLEKSRILAEREQLAESCRLLYVALTRAKSRCYFVWGRFRKAGSSAPAYVLHHKGEVGQGGAAALEHLFEQMGSEDLRRDLDELVTRACGDIHLAGPPPWCGERLGHGAGTPDELVPRRFTRRLDRGWSFASFSSLVGPADDGEAHARDVDPILAGGSATEETSPEEVAPLEGVFAFPRGARAGTCLHAVLERLDYVPGARHTLQPLVRAALVEHGFGLEWTEIVSKMVARVLNVPLEGGAGGTTLSALGRENRLNELGFYFPLRPLSSHRLREIFTRHAALLPEGAFPDALGRLTFSPVQGFMRGFIDLVFQHGGRYYLVDWKSNFLGPRVEDYAPGRLAQVMEASFYTLQYHLYVVALHRYLTLRVPGYAYESHFGGVYYLFLRGIKETRGGHSGIYRDRPAVQLIEDLSGNLIMEAP